MNIIVLCGGVSTEREISIVSGSGICKALRERGHHAFLIDVCFGTSRYQATTAFVHGFHLEEALEEIHSHDGEVEEARKDPGRPFFGKGVLELCAAADLVFLALHGEQGENGMVQATFDLLKIRYTGTGHLGSALAMDKNLSKIVFREAGIPTPGGFHMTAAHPVEDPTKEGLSFPVVVKVASGGSSVGVYIVGDLQEYRTALLEAFSYEGEVLVEEYIAGREFSVGVVEGKALPIIEIAPVEGFYDYKNKYTAGAAVETCPADLPEELTHRMQALAEAGYRALHLEGYGRLDFMMRENGEMFCLEANTLPGMTPTSLIPQEAKACGISYPEFCEQLIEVSMKKYRTH